MDFLSNSLKEAALMLIHFYRWVLSPLKTALLGPYARCRYYPSCSQYALEAITKHGIAKGGSLAVRRLMRCHPWNPGGYDPVPEDWRSRKPQK